MLRNGDVCVELKTTRPGRTHATDRFASAPLSDCAHREQSNSLAVHERAALPSFAVRIFLQYTPTANASATAPTSHLPAHTPSCHTPEHCTLPAHALSLPASPELSLYRPRAPRRCPARRAAHINTTGVPPAIERENTSRDYG